MTAQLTVAAAPDGAELTAQDWATTWSASADVVSADVVEAGTLMTYWRGLDFVGDGQPYVTELHAAPVDCADSVVVTELHRWPTRDAAAEGHTALLVAM